MYTRYLEPLFIELLSEFRILYLTGPRQAGKTTLVRSVSKALGIPYLTSDDFRHLIKFADFSGSLFLGGVVFYSGQTILSFCKNNIRLYALPIGLFI